MSVCGYVEMWLRVQNDANTSKLKNAPSHEGTLWSPDRSIKVFPRFLAWGDTIVGLLKERWGRKLKKGGQKRHPMVLDSVTFHKVQLRSKCDRNHE